jgi:hypothetical protein
MQIIAVTVAAITRLKAIQVDHPEDPIIRIIVRDLDQTRLNFSITLEAAAQPDGVTLDYTTTDGFRFLHSEPERSLPLLTIPTLN